MALDVAPDVGQSRASAGGGDEAGTDQSVELGFDVGAGLGAVGGTGVGRSSAARIRAVSADLLDRGDDRQPSQLQDTVAHRQ